MKIRLKNSNCRETSFGDLDGALSLVDSVEEQLCACIAIK